MRLADRHRKRLQKKAKRGVRAYPVGTVIFYGPDDRRASKVVACIIPAEGEETADMQIWRSDTRDLRTADDVAAEISAFLETQGAQSVVMVDRIFGCPHEEGIDYPEGEVCPQCPFWAEVDRYTGERI